MSDLPQIKGFLCGWTGSSGGHPPRRLGLPEPTGRPGQGRASSCRWYTCKVTRKSDGKTLEKLVGPGYHSRKHWQAAREKAFHEMIRDLGGKA